MDIKRVPKNDIPGALNCTLFRAWRHGHNPSVLPPLPTKRVAIYARVSTDAQSVDAQVAALTAAGAERVFREVASGAKTDRAQLRRLLDQLDAGDVLTVTRLDRLARSTRDLLNTFAAITGKQAGFRSLDDTYPLSMPRYCNRDKQQIAEGNAR